MKSISGFVAYPSEPNEVAQAIQRGLKILRDDHGYKGLSTWEENDIAGRFINEPILEKIRDSDCLIADVTRLNFNVTYEIGYAIGSKKRIFLVRNAALKKTSENQIREIGIFDTLGYRQYQNAAELADFLLRIADVRPFQFDDKNIITRSPVYTLTPKFKTDTEIHIMARIKKARLKFRTFDPEEQGRLSGSDAIANVSRSHGVIIPLLSSNRSDADVHNIRAAFLSGLAHGMEKLLLLLQSGDDPVPLDYRDLVSSFKFLNQLDDYISDFAEEITELLQAEVTPVVTEPRNFLARLNLGASYAENELFELGHYYLETDEFRRTARGEVQIVTGRKGSGKTALFIQVRDKVRQDRNTVVLDLKPEGFQLLRFKEQVLDLLEEGTREHTITAFWEYLLLLEVCHKLLEQDKTTHLHDHRLFEPYQMLKKEYLTSEYLGEGDFAERMLALTNRIAQDFQAKFDQQVSKIRLKTEELTELLFKHDVAKLMDAVHSYLRFKKGLWILFDNLDKGWPPHGLDQNDVLILRCLLGATSKIQRSLRRFDTTCTATVFIRNDVYELLVENTPDRGKISRVGLDWTDPDLLRELLRKRLLYNKIAGNPPFEEIWPQICASHVEGEESSQYLIERCLMRPRCLIDLLTFSRSYAVNLGHEKIEIEDIKKGEAAYSTDLVTNIALEIRDVFPRAEGILYELMQSTSHLSSSDLIEKILEKGIDRDQSEKMVDLFLWYGVIGFVRDNGETAYIYSVNYDMNHLKALIRKNAAIGVPIYCINPAFWTALEITP